MSLESDKIKGKEAQTLLDMPIFKEAWTAASEALASQRRKCPIKDSDMATRLVLAEQMLQAVKGYIEQLVVTGKMAEMQLWQAEQKSLRERMLARIGLVR